jgi:cytochrome c
MSKFWTAFLGTICVASLWPAESEVVTKGRQLYEKRCAGCHALDSVKVGPALRGIVGRRAAANPSFPYSDSLKKARLTWDEPTLDRWLANPEALVADNDMAYRLPGAEDRAAIIEYLKQLPAKRGQQ